MYYTIFAIEVTVLDDKFVYIHNSVFFMKEFCIGRIDMPG